MDDISSYEILNAIIEVLDEQVALSETDLIRETAKKFGFTRMGSIIETTIQNAIEQGQKRGQIHLNNHGKLVKV